MACQEEAEAARRGRHARAREALCQGTRSRLFCSAVMRLTGRDASPQSARRIQKWWKAYFRRAVCRLFLRKTKAATQIQRFARGWLARRWLHLWHNERTLLATKVQALFRGFYLRKRVLVAWMQWEFVNASRVQSVMRMYLCRRRCLHHQRMVAAVQIQAMWRGRTSRKRSDLLWLSAKAVNLQRLIRGVLARKKVRKMKIAQQRAATHIQRMFRGLEARKRVAAMLLDRETDNRLECMAVLDSEEEWHRIQRDKLQARLARLQLDQECVRLIDHAAFDSSSSSRSTVAAL